MYLNYVIRKVDLLRFSSDFLREIDPLILLTT